MLLEVKDGVSFILASQNLAQSFTCHQTSVVVVVLNGKQHGWGYLQKSPHANYSQLLTQFPSHQVLRSVALPERTHSDL